MYVSLRKHYVNNNKRAPSEQRFDADCCRQREMNRVTSRSDERALTRASRQKPCAIAASEKHDNCIMARMCRRVYRVSCKSRVRLPRRDTRTRRDNSRDAVSSSKTIHCFQPIDLNTFFSWFFDRYKIVICIDCEICHVSRQIKNLS